MKPEFDLAVVIGRFQPYHQGHAALIREAFEVASRVLVVVGSAHRARSTKNPFFWDERAVMINATLDDEQSYLISYIPARDYFDDARWAAAVSNSVQTTTKPGTRLVLVGHHKDHTSDYLKLFPQWPFHAVARHTDTNSTALRKLYYECKNDQLLSEQLPSPIFEYLEKWRIRPEFATLKEEFRLIKFNQKKWGKGPFVTVDAVVTQREHVLLIRRRHPPGKENWALPGGFLEGNERLLDAALRELKEETKLPVPNEILADELREVHIFDHVDRSQRGRIITHAHWFDLPNAPLPDVSGASDALEARWFPVSELLEMEKEFFEDHFMILDKFLKFVQ